jgi:hypothetical protein
LAFDAAGPAVARQGFDRLAPLKVKGIKVSPLAGSFLRLDSSRSAAGKLVLTA